MRWKDLNSEYQDPICELSKKTHYEIHGILENSNEDEIKNAYKRLARKYHPDKSVEFLKLINSEKMKLINSAYNKLMDTKK